MRILCIYTVEAVGDTGRPIASRKHIPFGISLVATVLKHSGHDVRLLVASRRTKLEHVLAAIVRDFRPRLLCLTAVSSQFPLVMKIAEIAKSLDRDIYVAVGGTHVSLDPNDAIFRPHVDAVCIGEGEKAVVELAAMLDEGKEPAGIPSFWFKQGSSNSIEKNLPAPFNQDLDSLPFMDREMWAPWVSDPHGTPAVLVGRGCHNRCTYCSNHALRRLAKGRYVRFRSVPNVISEIEILSRDPLVGEIYLEVETIGSDPVYAKELAAGLEDFNKDRANTIKFAINLAISGKLCNDATATDLLEAFRRANIHRLAIGLESGSERIRKEVLRRPWVSNEEFLNFCKLVKNHGMGIEVYLMLGLPTETPSDWLQTVEITRKCEPENVLLSIFCPYPGTDLYDATVAQGLFKPDDLTGLRERRNPAINSPQFPKWRIQLEYCLWPFRFLRGRKSLPRRIYWSAIFCLQTRIGLERFSRLLVPRSFLGRWMKRVFGSSGKASL